MIAFEPIGRMETPFKEKFGIPRQPVDSPIVRAFGSRDQFSGGAGLWIEFNVGGGSR